jgi:hypothetical protein
MITTKQRLDELIAKLEVATTDGDLSAFTGDDIGDIYSLLLLLQRGGVLELRAKS